MASSSTFMVNRKIKGHFDKQKTARHKQDTCEL